MTFKVKTYSLIDKEKGNSDLYYHQVASLTDRVMAKGQLHGDIIDKYHNYISKDQLRTELSREELILEFLLLGILWEIYLPQALAANDLIVKGLTHLSQLRNKKRFWKKAVDPLRGLLTSLIFRNRAIENMSVTEDNLLEYFGKLLKWLRASGDFKEEVIRLERWYQFFSKIAPIDRKTCLAEAKGLAHWFNRESSNSLGQYTYNVDSFIEDEGNQHRRSEDMIFVNRQPIEYHLNMVGAEILNRIYRKEFLKAKRKLILLPSCMRINGSQCQAQKSSLGLVCQNCNSECNVAQLNKTAQSEGLEVYIIPHESMLFTGSQMNSSTDEVAIIGVACVLQLIEGGWKASSLGLPAQCILLDYCGCKSHWDSEGIITDINYNKLKEIIKDDE